MGVRGWTQKVQDAMQTYIGKTMPKNSDPNIYRKSDKIHDQVDPKWSQNEAKSDTKAKQPLQDALRGLRRQIFRLGRIVKAYIFLLFPEGPQKGE